MHRAPLTATSLSARWHEMAIGRLLPRIRLTSTTSSLSASGYAMETTEPLRQVPDNLMRPSLRVAFTSAPNVSDKERRSSASTFLAISDSYHGTSCRTPEYGFSWRNALAPA